MGKLNYVNVFPVILIILLKSHLLYSQVNQQWVANFNGPGDSFDGANDIAIDPFGNVYITGISFKIGSGNDYVTIKYNSAGIEQWDALYNGTGNSDDYAHSLAIDNSGNVYVTGYSYDSASSYDYVTIKYNSAGSELWVARYNGPGNLNDIAFSIDLDDSNNLYVTGASIGSGSGEDYATLKYNSDGIVQWVARYNGTGNNNDVAYSIAADNMGNSYVTGGSSGTALLSEYATVKYNSAGELVWVSKYSEDSTSFGEASSIVLDHSGNVYVTGYSQNNTNTFTDYATIKYNSEGVKQWAAKYNGSDSLDDYAKSITVDNSGNVYITGKCQDSLTHYDFTTVKYNSSGFQQWAAIFNGPANLDDEAFSIALDESSNVYVTGFQTGNGSSNDYTTVKYNKEGQEQWTVIYNGPANEGDDAVAMEVDNKGNIYVSGYSSSIGGGTDITTIKYAQLTSIKQIPQSLPFQFSLSQNYPNPFNPGTVIRYSLIGNHFVTLIIFDALGKQVITLVNENQSTGTYQIDFDGSNLPCGVYFYTLSAGDLKESKKMMILK